MYSFIFSHKTGASTVVYIVWQHEYNKLLSISLSIEFISTENREMLEVFSLVLTSVPKSIERSQCLLWGVRQCTPSDSLVYSIG